MKNNKLKQVKEKIVEILPEIMELKFGCELEIRDWYDNEFITPYFKEKIWIQEKVNHIKGRVFETEWVWKLSDDQLIGNEQLEYAKKYPNCADNAKKITILG